MTPKLDNLTRIKSNDRFDTFKADYNGMAVFAKKAKSQKTQKNLENQYQNARKINEIGSKNFSRPLRSPLTIYFSEDWLVTEWLETENLGPIVTTSTNKVAIIMADYFTLFDKQKSSAKKLRVNFTQKDLEKKVNERLRPNIRDQKLVDDGLKRFVDFSKCLTPALQDADIKPFHIYYDSNTAGGFVLIDSEHLSDDWPRYYDLGNNIAKYFVRNELEYCRAITKRFCEQATVKQSTVFEPLISILIVRSLAMLWSPDFETDIPKFGSNKALELLKRCTEVKSLTNLLY